MSYRAAVFTKGKRMDSKASKLAAAALLGGSVVLTACSSTGAGSPGKETASVKPSSSSATGTPTTAAAPGSSETHGGGGILPPVTVKPDEHQVSIPTGGTLYFSLSEGGWGEPGDFSVVEGIKDLENVNEWTIASDTPEVLSVTPGSDNGNEATAPTAQALVPGTAQVRLVNAKAEYLWVLDVTVEPSGDTVNALPEDQSVKARVGDVVTWQDFPSEETFGQVTVASDDESVVSVLPQGFVVLSNVASSPGYIPAAARLWAKAEGTATVTIENPATREKRSLTVFVGPPEPNP